MFKRFANRDEQGASLVEMALVMVLLLTLLAGIADLGRVFYTYIAITNASREGARYASRFPNNAANIRSRVNDELAETVVGPLPIDQIDISTDTAPGDPIRVTVTYQFSAGDSLSPVLLAPFLRSDTIQLRASTEMVIFGIDQ